MEAWDAGELPGKEPGAVELTAYVLCLLEWLTVNQSECYFVLCFLL